MSCQRSCFPNPLKLITHSYLCHLPDEIRPITIDYGPPLSSGTSPYVATTISLSFILSFS
jgi:hypothetical protein